MKIYVGNLSFQSSENEIRDLFGQFGEVAEVTLITDAVGEEANIIWGTVLDENYQPCTAAWLVSPAIDLSACSGADEVTVAWWHVYWFEPMWNDQWCDGGIVQLSGDDGGTWENVVPSVKPLNSEASSEKTSRLATSVGASPSASSNAIPFAAR